MREVKIFAMGFLAALAIAAVVMARMRHDEAQKGRGLKVIRSITPEALIARCGQPTSDKSSMFIIRDGVRYAVDMGEEPTGQRPALGRSIEYTRTQGRPWARFDFFRDIDNHGQVGQWRLTHFASTEVGTSPADDNAYIAVSEFPCMAETIK